MIFAEVRLDKQAWTGEELTVNDFNFLVTLDENFNQIIIDGVLTPINDFLIFDEIKNRTIKATSTCQVLAVGKLIGQFKGHPLIKTKIKKNIVKKNNINGKIIVNYLNERFEATLNFKDYPQNGDEIILQKLQNSNKPFLFYPNLNSTNIFLKKKIYKVQSISDDTLNTYKNYHNIPIFNSSLGVVEVD